MPNPNHTILNYPYTRKAKTQQQQQRSMTRSTSQDIHLNLPQQFATTTKHSLSIPGDLPFLTNDVILISKKIFEKYFSLLDDRFFTGINFNFGTKC